MNDSKNINKENTSRENRIWLRIASACNVKCIFCLDSDAQNGTLVPDDEIYQKISHWFKEGYINRIIISWWEASIHPRFSEYIRFAKEKWYNKIQTVTNGNMFSRYEYCEKVVTAWLSEVTFSIHWHTPELHDYFTDAPWSFKKAIQGIIILKKYFPQVIINIDVVVNKVNVIFLPNMLRFFMKLWVYEFDILQIIPFWRWFQKYKNTLFYKVEDYIDILQDTWKYSKKPWVYMWTNRFPAEAFEGYEELIQDPRKIKSEVMWEAYNDFSSFISSKWVSKPHCFGEACNYCFLKQYCHDYLASTWKNIQKFDSWFLLDWITLRFPHSFKDIILRWEEFMSDIYKKYGDTASYFLDYIRNLELSESQKLLNVPRCIRWDSNNWKYEDESNFSNDKTLEWYTQRYINNFYRKKSLSCVKCKYNNDCQWIHINFIRAYGFSILKPILDDK